MNTTSPFKFLDAYEKNEFDHFFGRERETAQLYNAVFASNLTLLYGASGTGKTSLVNCGLGNKFYETDWLPLFIRREQNINESLDNALRKALVRQVPEDFPDLPVEEKTHLLYLDHFKPIYLIFDQFEELFVLGKDNEAKTFYQTIQQLLTAGLQTKVLIIIREEWIAYLNDLEKILPSLFDNRLRIERMNDRNVYRVIAGLTRHFGITVEEPAKTIMQIIDNLRDRHERVDLTNLQVYLDRLYRTAAEKAGAERIIFTPGLVTEVGKIDNVLSEFLDEQLLQLETELQKRGVANARGLPLEILFAMVTEEGTKQALHPEAILNSLPVSRGLDKADLEYCLAALQRIKLLRPVSE